MLMSDDPHVQSLLQLDMVILDQLSTNLIVGRMTTHNTVSVI